MASRLFLLALTSRHGAGRASSLFRTVLLQPAFCGGSGVVCSAAFHSVCSSEPRSSLALPHVHPDSSSACPSLRSVLDHGLASRLNSSFGGLFSRVRMDSCCMEGSSTMQQIRYGTTTSGPFLTDHAKLIDSVETFIFDCDGVIWRGDVLIDGAPETLDMLRSKGKHLVFVTNNSTKSRKQFGKKFEALGNNVFEEEIFSSSFAAAAYMKSINFPSNKKVYIIGEADIQLEFKQAGINCLGGPKM